MKKDETMRNDEQQPIEVVITDNEGIEHNYRLLTNFQAGNLNKTYSALMLQDVRLFRYLINEYGECGEELADVDFARAEKEWEDLQTNGSINEESIRENVVLNLLDLETMEYAPCYGTILATFGDFVAFYAPTIHFYRCNIEENGENISLSFESIVSQQEFEDVADAFNKMMAEATNEE